MHSVNTDFPVGEERRHQRVLLKGAKPGMSVRIEPLSPAIGAEVTGVDPRRPLDAGTVAELEAAFGEYGVLLFREAPMTPPELTAFSRYFGALQPHVQRAYRHPEAPEVVVMTNQHADGSFDETGARRGAIEDVRYGWHSDLSYDPKPAKATLLHATNIPSSGGNSCFANAAAAYEALPEGTRERVRGLDALFVYGTDQRNKSLVVAARTLDSEQRAVHPVVNAHAATGRAGIYANPLPDRRRRRHGAGGERPAAGRALRHARPAGVPLGA